MTNEKPTSVRYGVLAWLCAAAVVSYLHRNAIAVAEDTIREELTLSAGDMGSIFSAFFLGYALLQVPAGWVADRWGTRGPLTMFALAWTFAFGLMAGARGFYEFLVLRFVCGAAQAGAFPCATRSIVEWLPAARRALASGLLGSCMSLGGALANGMMGTLLANDVDWRTAIAEFVAPGLLWSVGFYAWFRDRPEEHASVNQAEAALIRKQRPLAPPPRHYDLHSPTPWLAILTSAPIWFLCGQQFFRAAGYVFYATWFPTYLKETHGVATDEAGWLSSLPLFAVVAGSPLGGWFADRLLTATASLRVSRQGIGVASMLLSAAFVLPANWVGDAPTAVLLISAGSFFASFGGPVAYAAAMDLGGRYVGTVFGIVNMGGNLGAAVFPKVASTLRASTDNWQWVLFTFCGVYVAAAVCWLCIDPDQVIGEEKRL
jgi:sugar phosphate permease